MTSTNSEQGPKSFLQRVMDDLLSQAGRVGKDVELSRDALAAFVAGGVIDDRNHLLEKIVDIAASLPNGSKVRDDLSAKFVKTLWNRLEHPPISYIGDQFKYRAADGSNNNVQYPSFGAAGSPYARSVVPQHMKQDALPDPAVIFDTLLVRNGKAKPHPNQISSMLFYLATIIIHDLFHTESDDRSRTKASSYLDLGPLYGHNEAQQKKVRTFKDGLLKKDAFSESRLLGQPPGVCAFLIAFNRFHNYVVGEMAIINEGGRFSLPRGVKPGDKEYDNALLKRDNDLFQTGRLVTCGLYCNMILGDYLRAILNLNQNPSNPGSNWSLDPRGAGSVVGDSSILARGTGNQVSVEFSMIYAWHSAISDHDEEWAKKFMKTIFGDIDTDKLSFMQFLGGLKGWIDSVPEDPAKWEFGGKKRTADGSFSDGDLVNLITTATKNAGGAFGARNVPAIMKAIEILGIQHGREWNIATLNEVRLYFGLKPHATFLEVNSDSTIADALQSVYDTPDDIELYVGLKVEEAKLPFFPGSGLCPGSTVGTAVLADAVALVRGDRFYTVDYSPANLTNFGFNAANSDFDVASSGVIYKLLTRAFPGFYRPNSVYALYPLTTPDKNKSIFKDQGRIKDFTYDEPVYIAPPVPVSSWQAVTDVLNDQTKFKVTYERNISQITGQGFILGGDIPAGLVKASLYQPDQAPEEVQKFYNDAMSRLLKEKSRKLGDKYSVDIVRDIGNLIHATFIGQFFGIPISETSGAKNAVTAQELYGMLSSIFEYMYLDVETATSFKKSVTATRSYKKLSGIMSTVLAGRKDGPLSVSGIKQMISTKSAESILSGHGSRLIDKMFTGGKKVEEVASTLLVTAAALMQQCTAWASLIDLFLSDEYSSHWSAIQALSKSEKPEDFNMLKKYVLEGSRLSCPQPGATRIVAAQSATIKDGSQSISLKEGDLVFVDFATASLDASKFPDPKTFKLDRPEASYINFGVGPHSCLGQPISVLAAATMLKSIGKVKNLKRVPGKAGEIRSKVVGGTRLYLTTDASAWVGMPQSKKVVFDSF